MTKCNFHLLKNTKCSNLFLLQILCYCFTQVELKVLSDKVTQKCTIYAKS